MPNDTTEKMLESLPQLYLDLLWNIDASARIMLTKLPVMADHATDVDLTTLLRDSIGVVSHHQFTLQNILKRFDQPARVHAAELETLVGHAAGLADWPAGEVRDVALSDVVRTVIHMAIPPCEIAMNIAGALGYETQIEALASFHHDLLNTDGRLIGIVRGLLDAHTRWTGTHIAAGSPRNDARR